MRPQRGDVCWATIAGKRRPALVLTRDSMIPLLKTVTVVPATTHVRGIPAEVGLGPDDGMPKDCALSFDNVFVIPQSGLRGRICTLSPGRLEEVCDALAYTFGC